VIGREGVGGMLRMGWIFGWYGRHRTGALADIAGGEGAGASPPWRGSAAGMRALPGTGATGLYRVYVILTTGNEKGSKTVSITRPLL